MAEEIIINAKINTGNSAKDIKEVATSTKDLRGKISDTEREVDRMSKTYGENSAQTDRARKELVKLNLAYDQQAKATNTADKKLERLNQEVQSGTLNVQQLAQKLKEYETIAFQAGSNSPIGKKAIQDASVLKDRLDSLKNRTKELANDGANLKAALTLGSGVVQGYQGVLGVSTLLGNENERLVETLTKLQASQGIVNSLSAVRQALDKDSVLILKAKTIAQLAENKAQKAYALVVGTSTKGLKLFKVALAATGIGALLIGLGLLIANFEEVSKWIKRMADKFEFIRPIIDYFQEQIDNVRMSLQLLGIIDDEQTAKAKKNAQSRVDSKEKERQKIGETYDYEIAKAQAAGKNTFDLEQKKRSAILETIKTQALALQEQVKLTGEFTEQQKEAMQGLIDLARKTAEEIAVSEIAENKKVSEARKVSNTKRVDDKKLVAEEEAKLLAEEIKREDEQFKLMNELRLSDKELEIQQINEQFEKKFEIALGNAELEKELFIQQQEDINAIDLDYKNKAIADELDKASKIKAIKDKEKKEVDKNAEDEKKFNQDVTDAKLGLASMATSAILANMEQGSNAAKGIAAAQVVFDTYRGIQATFASAATSPIAIANPSFPFIQAGVAASFGFANVKKILSAKPATKSSGGGGGGSSRGGSSASSGVNAQSNPTALFGNSFLGADQLGQGNKTIIRAEVNENEITKAQNDNANYANMASL